MLQVRWFIAVLFILTGIAATQDASSRKQTSVAGAKKAGTELTTRPAVVPNVIPFKRVTHPVAVNRRALMKAQHADIASALSQANLPSSGKVHSFPLLTRANFLSPANSRIEAFPESKAPHVNTRKLLMAKPRDMRPVK